MKPTKPLQKRVGQLFGSRSFPGGLGNVALKYLASRLGSNRAKAQKLRMKYYLKLRELMETIGKSLEFTGDQQRWYRKIVRTLYHQFRIAIL